MQTDSFMVALAGGLESRLPQNPENADEITNFVVERRSGGWSTRLGYEPYRPGLLGEWAPFASDGPIYGLHVAQALAGGARQHILYEELGNLSLLYEAGSGAAPLKRVLATGRTVPTPTEAGPWYTDTPHGTVVTNGNDRPVLVQPWPLGNAAESTSALPELIRPFGFDAPPEPPQPHRVQPMPAAVASSTATGGGSTTLWCLGDAGAIADGGRWGLGFKANSGSSPGKEALFGWSVAFISTTGSEGPRSPIQSTLWELPAGAIGFRYAVALDVPTGPPGTVARKLYRTSNYGADYVNQGDTTLYFVGIIRNNTDTIFYDAVQTADLGQAAPVVATGPLPAPRARFSAIFKQCLFLDGGLDDPTSIYYSAPGRIEQFGADAVLELSSNGGGVTALWGDYTLLVIFREQGIDVVQGDYLTGFQVSTLSNTVQCRAPHTIKAVPGLGLVFLALDGVYALLGGLQGGAISDIVKLSDGWDREAERITADCHPKSVAVYSAQERAYQLYVPADGLDRPSQGYVLHLDRLARSPDTSAWSQRTGFPVGAISTFHNGAVVFGHHTGNESGNTSSERGLFILSARRAMGGTVPQVDVFTLGDPPTSTYRSAWNDFGDAQLLKQVQYVTLFVLTTGEPAITMRHYKDFSKTATVERTYRMQPPDAALLDVLNTVVVGSGSWRDARLVPIRYSVAEKSCSHFAFEIETTADIVLLGYELGYAVRGTLVTRGKV